MEECFETAGSDLLVPLPLHLEKCNDEYHKEEDQKEEAQVADGVSEAVVGAVRGITVVQGISLDIIEWMR